VYRKGTYADCKNIYDLICELEQKELPFDKFSAIYQEQLNNKNYYCLVCEREQSVRGVLNLRFEAQLHHSEYVAEIMEFAVDPAYRNKGIGKEMLAKACKLAKEFGCNQIEVACNQLREDTHRFYLREGLHNFHFKFSRPLSEDDIAQNTIGR